MNRSAVLVFLVLAIVAAPVAWAKTLRLGCVYSSNELWSSLGDEGAKGAALAVDLINAKGGINGDKVEIVSKKAPTDPMDWPKLVDSLKKQGVFAIVGMNDGDLAQAVEAEATAVQIPVVVAGVSNKVCAGEGCFQASYSNQAQASAMALLAKDKLADGMIFLQLTDTDSNADLAGKLKKAYKALGGVVMDTIELSDNGDEVEKMLARLTDQAVTPGGFFVIAPAGKSVEVIKKIRAGGLDQLIVCRDTMDAPGIANQMQQDPSLVLPVQCAYSSPASAVKNFINHFRNKYGAAPDSGFAAIGFDAAAVVMEAAIVAGATDCKSLANALANSISYTGPSGKISFTPSRHEPDKTVPCVSFSGGGQYLGDFK